MRDLSLPKENSEHQSIESTLVLEDGLLLGNVQFRDGVCSQDSSNFFNISPLDSRVQLNRFGLVYVL